MRITFDGNPTVQQLVDALNQLGEDPATTVCTAVQEYDHQGFDCHYESRIAELVVHNGSVYITTGFSGRQLESGESVKLGLAEPDTLDDLDDEDLDDDFDEDEADETDA